MANELLELSRMRADMPPANEAAMARARAALVREATSPLARQRRRSPVRIAATALAGTAAVAALVVVPTAGQNAPGASAVTINDDGTVTVEMADVTSLANLAAANKVLAEAGIRAELITYQPTCAPGSELNFDSPVPDDLLIPIPFEERMERVVSFRPDRIPADMTLVLLTMVDDDGFKGWWEVDIRPDGEIVVGGPSVPTHLIPEGAGTCFQYF